MSGRSVRIEDILAVRMAEKTGDYTGQCAQSLQCAKHFLLQVHLVDDGLLCHARLDVAPHLLIRIEMRGVRRQDEQLQPSCLRLDELAHDARLVRAVPVDDEEHRAVAVVVQQALAEVDEDLRRDAALVHHEEEPPVRGHRGQHVEAEALAGGRHRRRAGDRRPCGAGMMIGAHAGIVAEEDPRTDALGLGGNRRIILSFPALHQHRIAFARSAQGPLRAKAQRRHRPAYGRTRELDLELTLNDLADQRQRPQRKLEPMLLRRRVAHHAAQPAQMLGLELRRASRDRLRLQCLLSPIGVGCKPTIDRTLVDAKGCGDAADQLAALHRRDCLITHRLQ